MKVLSLLLFFFAGDALAQATVYKTVDEQGVVTFSDTPPSGTGEVERMQINTPAPQPTDEYRQNLEAMRETTDRMAEDRRQREKHRAEMRELQARTDAMQAPPPQDLEGYRSYYPAYGGYYRPGHPPWRPGYRPKPEHPIARPPVRPQPHTRPGQQRPTQGNSQLMRPILTR